LQDAEISAGYRVAMIAHLRSNRDNMPFLDAPLGSHARNGFGVVAQSFPQRISRVCRGNGSWAAAKKIRNAGSKMDELHENHW
jgi:hypothetical protein